MSLSKRFIGHLKTITTHKFLVMKLCFKCGLYMQGLLHDLSKYSPVEFFNGVRYYQGYRSPIDEEKEEIGYSKAWLHHKGRNKHHWEYWLDFNLNGQLIAPLAMPYNYIIESVLDKIAASKVYRGKDYTDDYPLYYFEKGNSKNIMHQYNAKQFKELLSYLAINGEEKALAHYAKLYKDFKNSKRLK